VWVALALGFLFFGGGISRVYFVIIIVFGFLLPKVVFKLLYRRNPYATGRVKDISNMRFDTVAFIEFEYEGSVYQIEEKCNGEDQRELNVGDELEIIVNKKNPNHSQVFDDGNIIWDILMALAISAIILMYK